MYVGDDERDIMAGMAAGMGTVAATYGYLGAMHDRELGRPCEIDTAVGAFPSCNCSAMA
jgi:phosphoglycolate phosphatase-like HAD superfamily hydrolase